MDMLRVMAKTFKTDNFMCLSEVAAHSKLNPDGNDIQTQFYISKIMNDMAKSF